MEHTFMCAMHACRVAICGMLSPDCSPLSKEYSLISNTTDSPAKAPLKKVLTKNRYYLETGVIAYDDAVLQYMQKLEDHRKKCEVSWLLADACMSYTGPAGIWMHAHMHVCMHVYKWFVRTGTASGSLDSMQGPSKGS